MVHQESGAQSHNESPGQMSPQPSMKRKKFDDDDLNGSKKARTRVRFVCHSFFRGRGSCLKLDLLGYSYSCGECHRRKQKVRSDVLCPRIVTTSHSVIAKFPVPTYASVLKFSVGDTLTYISSVWLARSLNCVRHIRPVNLIRISTFVLLA